MDIRLIQPLAQAVQLGRDIAEEPFEGNAGQLPVSDHPPQQSLLVEYGFSRLPGALTGSSGGIASVRRGQPPGQQIG